MSEPTVELDGLVLPAGTIVGHAADVSADNYDPDPHPQVGAWDGEQVTFTPTVSLVVYESDDGPVILRPRAEVGRFVDGRLVLDIPPPEGEPWNPLRLWASTGQPMIPAEWGYTMSGLPGVNPRAFPVEPGATIDIGAIVAGLLPDVPPPSYVDLLAALAEMRDLRTESTDAADSATGAASTATTAASTATGAASTATTAASTAVAARDATLAASTIVGVGRPDIPATLTTPGTAALVSAATSGTVFRSLDGPQGAWEWRKKGSAWVPTDANTGWIDASSALSVDWSTAGVASGACRLMRDAAVASLDLRCVIPPGSSLIGVSRALSRLFVQLPTWAAYSANYRSLGTVSSPGGLTTLSYEDGRKLNTLAGSGAWAAGDVLSGHVSWRVPSSATYPTTLTL